MTLAHQLIRCPECGQLYQPDDPTAAPDPRADDAWTLTPLGWAGVEEIDRERRRALADVAAMETATRAQLRDLLREFISSTPESEPKTLLELRWPDGGVRHVTRGHLTARMRWLRPRQRRILEQRHVLHRPRYAVVAELGCSMKTLEREEAAAFDLLLAETTAGES